MRFGTQVNFIKGIVSSLESSNNLSRSQKKKTIINGRFFGVFFIGLFLSFSVTSNAQITAFPYSEGWEGGKVGSWTQATSDDFDWENNSAGTGSLNTGPSSASEGSQYIYTETSPQGNGDVAIIRNDFDFSGLMGAELVFDYHMYFDGASNGGTLDVDVSTDGGSTWTNIFKKSGDQGNQWNNARVSLSSFDDTKIKLRFRFKVGNNTSFENDCAIDDVKIENAIPIGPTTAAFSVPDTVTVNTTTCIKDASQAAASINWYVNGNDRGSSETLKFRPTSTGSQIISLSAVNSLNRDSISQQVYVQTPTVPKADFSASQNIVDPNTTVQFTDLSKNGPTEWEWSFSPNVFTNVIFTSGTGASCLGIANSDSAKNPEALFLFPNSYDVTLIASNQAGKDTLTKKDHIIVRQSPNNICLSDQSTADYGSIVDDGGEANDYSNNRNCNFTLNTCKRTVLQVEEFDLAAGDFLRVYDGNSPSGTPLWDTTKFGSQGMTGSKGDIKSRFVGESGSVYVEFESDNSQVGSGFRLNWSTQPLQNVKAPTPAIAGPSSVCPRTPANFRARNPQDGVSYTWDTVGVNNKGEATTGKMANLTFPYKGSWKVTLTGANCIDTVSVTKTVNVGAANNAPSANFGADSRRPVIGQVVKFSDSAKTCTDFYEWQFDKPVNFVSGSRNSPEPEVVFLQEGCYEVTLSVGNSVDTITRTKSCFIDVKCGPTVANLKQDLGINEFDFANIKNNTESGQTAFSSFFNDSGLKANVERGGTYQLTVRRSTSFNDQDLKVWLDINGDGQFSSQEVLVSKTRMGRSYSRMVTIPDTTVLDDIRLRVGVNLSGEPIKACGFNRFGEFEDYKVSVTKDQTPPMITLNGPDTVMLGACEDPAIVDTGVSAMDAIQGPVSPVNRTIFVDSSTAGIDSIRYTASDGVGNTAVATRYVRVMADQTPPQATLPGPDTVQSVVFTSYNDPSTPSVSDQCSGIAGVSVKNIVDTSNLGTYAYNYVVSDQAGNTTMVSRTVRVVDTTAPAFMIAGNDPVRLRLGGTYQEPGIMNLSDNYWENGDLKVTIANEAVVTSRVDTFMVTYTVEDGSGNTATKQRQVIIEDKVAPEVTAQLDGRELDNGDTVTVPVNEAIDFRSRVKVTDNSRFGATVERSGNYFSILDNQGRPGSLGFYEAEWTFADKSGNATSLNLVVEVVDNEAPELTLKPKDRTITIGIWDTTVYEAFDSAVMATDNHYVKSRTVDTTSTYFTDFLANRPAAPGLYVIRYTATDSAGNSASKELVFDARTTGIESAADAGIELSVYPNPTDGRITIELDEDLGRGRMEIVDATGRQVRQIQADGQLLSGTYRVDLRDQSSGVYFLRLRSGDTVVSKEIILQQ